MAYAMRYALTGFIILTSQRDIIMAHRIFISRTECWFRLHFQPQTTFRNFAAGIAMMPKLEPE